MAENSTQSHVKKKQENIFHVIMEAKPAVILEKRQIVEMPHGVYIFENIPHSKSNSPIELRIYALD